MPIDKPAGLFVTDYDGTLLRSDGTASQATRRVLCDLSARGVVTAIATGRSLYSFRKSHGLELPVDYVLFSSGAGVLEKKGEMLVRHVNMPQARVNLAIRDLLAIGVDFMIHGPVPDNHYFHYVAAGHPNPDFENRLRIYEPFSTPLDGRGEIFTEAAQLLVVLPHPEPPGILERIRKQFPDLSVIRTTSPLDGRSVWVEIFNPAVSKSLTVKWLCGRLGISENRVCAVGNDYNDLDLLQWAPQRYVVANAPEDLRAVFPVVPANDQDGMVEAARLWLRRL